MTCTSSSQSGLSGSTTSTPDRGDRPPRIELLASLHVRVRPAFEKLGDGLLRPVVGRGERPRAWEGLRDALRTNAFHPAPGCADGGLGRGQQLSDARLRGGDAFALQRSGVRGLGLSGVGGLAAGALRGEGGAISVMSFAPGSALEMCV